MNIAYKALVLIIIIFDGIVRLTGLEPVFYSELLFSINFSYDINNLDTFIASTITEESEEELKESIGIASGDNINIIFTRMVHDIGVFFCANNIGLFDKVMGSSAVALYNFYFLLFCFLLIISCIYLYKKLDVWISTSNLLIYSKKELLLRFLTYYLIILVFLLFLLNFSFNNLFIDLSFPLKLLLNILFISIITLAFMVTIYIKRLAIPYSIKRVRSVYEYETSMFDFFLTTCEVLPNGQVLDITTKEDITDKYMEYKSFYENLDKTHSFWFIQRNVNFLINVFICWLNFYIFILNSFLIFLTFSYFYYFDISFYLYSSIYSSMYIYGFLSLILCIRFYQNYYILFKIGNDRNGDKLAAYTFYKQALKYYYFGFSKESTYIYSFIRWIFPVICFMIFLLINCRIIYIIYNKLYFKNNISLFTLLFKIPFGPVLDNLQLNETFINKFLYFLLNNFIGLFLILAFLLIVCVCFSIYFKSIYYIWTEKLSKNGVVPCEYNLILLKKEDEIEIKKKLDTDSIPYDDFNNVIPAYLIDIVWFKNLKSFIKENYYLYGFTKIKFYINNLYLLFGSLLHIIIFVFLIFYMYYNYRIYSEINLFQQFIFPLIFFSKFSQQNLKVYAYPRFFGTKRFFDKSYSYTSLHFKQTIEAGQVVQTNTVFKVKGRFTEKHERIANKLLRNDFSKQTKLNQPIDKNTITDKQHKSFFGWVGNYIGKPFAQGAAHVFGKEVCTNVSNAVKIFWSGQQNTTEKANNQNSSAQQQDGSKKVQEQQASTNNQNINKNPNSTSTTLNGQSTKNSESTSTLPKDKSSEDSSKSFPPSSSSESTDSNEGE